MRWRLSLALDRVLLEADFGHIEAGQASGVRNRVGELGDLGPLVEGRRSAHVLVDCSLFDGDQLEVVLDFGIRGIWSFKKILALEKNLTFW